MSAPNLSEALALMNQGALTEARAICMQHLAHAPHDFNARHLLGLVQFKAGNLLAATKELTKAARQVQQPRFKAQAINNLTLVLQARGKHEQALAMCRETILLQPDEVAFHLNLLSQLEQRQQWQAIIHHMQSTPLLTQNADAQLYHAVASRHLMQHDTALGILERLPTSIEVESERALNLCLQGESNKLLTRCKALHATPEQLTRLADYCAEEGHPVAAAPLYRAAAEAAPQDLNIRHMLNAAEGQCTAAAPVSYVRELYDTHAEQFESRLQEKLAYQAPQQLCRHLAALVDQTGALNAADLGCGTGLCGEELRKQLPIGQLTGCDLSPQMLRQAARKEVYTELACRPLLEYLDEMTPVQLITATDVLIYMGNLEPLMAPLQHALTSRGLFAFTVERGNDADGVSLHASGRYRHSQTHIRALAETYDFTICLMETFTLRLEHDTPVEGLMIILKRND